MSEPHLALDELLDEDLSSYEFFQTLPTDIQRKIRARDARTFDELQALAGQLRSL